MVVITKTYDEIEISGADVVEYKLGAYLARFGLLNAWAYYITLRLQNNI